MYDNFAVTLLQIKNMFLKMQFIYILSPYDEHYIQYSDNDTLEYIKNKKLNRDYKDYSFASVNGNIPNNLLVKDLENKTLILVKNKIDKHSSYMDYIDIVVNDHKARIMYDLDWSIYDLKVQIEKTLGPEFPHEKQRLIIGTELVDSEDLLKDLDLENNIYLGMEDF